MKLIKISKRDNLDRYYLLQMFGFGLFLHKIHHDEDVDTFHNHPWNGVSFILGSYIEERFGCPKATRKFFNTIKAKRFHRVELKKPVWTLFLHGRRCNKWQVIDRAGVVLDTEPWRDTTGRKSYKR